MDPRLIRLYNEELAYFRATGEEFAAEFPKVARRLNLSSIEVVDPYVERLLEGSALLSARARLELDSAFPRFTQHLLEMLYPNFLAPVPALGRVLLQPDPDQLQRAQRLPRGSRLQSARARAGTALCEFSTAADCTLLPLTVHSAQYFTLAPDLPLTSLPLPGKFVAGLRLQFRTLRAGALAGCDVPRFELAFAPPGDLAWRLHALIHGRALGAFAFVSGRVDAGQWFPREALVPTGLLDDESLLPVDGRTPGGLRLMQEYLAFPQRFFGFRIEGLNPARLSGPGEQIELALLFGAGDRRLETALETRHFHLNVVPVVNLVSRRCERIHVSDASSEFHVLPDRMQPLDYEVHHVESVAGHGENMDGVPFRPLYSPRPQDARADGAHYVTRRLPRMLTQKQRREGNRSNYVGTELYLSLAVGDAAPWPTGLRQLAVRASCSNRDLPLLLSLGEGKTDLVVESGAPVLSVRFLDGPSRPLSAVHDGELPWRFLNHLSLNHLALVDLDPDAGAAVLRELLHFACPDLDAVLLAQVNGLRSVRARGCTRRFPGPGPIAFARGVEVELAIDELAFEGAHPYLFGLVLSEYLRRQSSINSFVDTRMQTLQGAEIGRWSARLGQRAVL